MGCASSNEVAPIKDTNEGRLGLDESLTFRNKNNNNNNNKTAANQQPNPDGIVFINVIVNNDLKEEDFDSVTSSYPPQTCCKAFDTRRSNRSSNSSNVLQPGSSLGDSNSSHHSGTSDDSAGLNASFSNESGGPNTTQNSNILCGSAQDYVRMRPLGSGQSGVVYLGMSRKTRRYVAIKHLGKVRKDSAAFDIPEVKYLQMCYGHPCIVQLQDVITQHSITGTKTSSAAWLVMEHVDGASWGSSVAAQRQGPWCGTGKSQEYILNRTRGILRDLLMGLQFLHDVAGVAHMDIKAENIIVLSEYESGRHAKLIDLGSVVRCRDKAKTTSTAGTLYYCSPEKVQGGTTTPYCPKAADIWALGIATLVGV
eukprot:PhF_6_TR18902/c0_g2_i2/m.27575